MDRMSYMYSWRPASSELVMVWQVWVVSSCVPQLPLQIEDAARRITEDDEGVFARVNQVSWCCPPDVCRWVEE